nr:juvenile hormone acid O-methyltransferase-like [Onthophagus taurus]
MFDAHIYEQYFSPVHTATKQILSDYGLLINWPNKQENQSDVMKILDAGCGDGTSTVHVFKELVTENVENYQIFGVDVSKEMILSANKKYKDEKNCEFGLMDLSLKTFPVKLTEKFDLIYSMHCLQWVKTTHWIKNFYKMLKPSGQIFLIAITENIVINSFLAVNKREKFCQYQEPAYWDNHFYTKINLEEWLKPLLKDAGYTNIIIKHNDKKLKFLNKELLKCFIKSFKICHNHLPTNLIDDYLNEVIEEFIKESLNLYGTCSPIFFKMPVILISAEK